ncbi:MAG: DUF3604 domain-containing protein [Chitinivibrionales bacterium]|nr:DUF3604 domain-containing protein [Chitinivibrionales bacterium]
MRHGVMGGSRRCDENARRQTRPAASLSPPNAEPPAPAKARSSGSARPSDDYRRFVGNRVYEATCGAEPAKNGGETMTTQIFTESSLSPTNVVAGDSACFSIRLTIGDDYTEGPSRIVFDFPATVSMSRPTRLHQEESGYLEALVSNPHVRYSLRVWDMEILDFPTKTKTSWRGMAARMGVLDLDPGLRAGDTIELLWGATGGGYGGGTKVTHVVPCTDYECTIHVRYFTSHDEGLPDLGRSFEGYERPAPACEIPLAFAVEPRPIDHLRLLRRFDRCMLLAHDMYGNIGPVADIREVADSKAPFTANEHGVFVCDDPKAPVQARSLPLTVAPDMRDVHDGYNVYWGDIHTHTAFSNDCIEREKLQMTPDDLMVYARERAGLDFYAPTDHHQPWDQPRNRIGRERWEATIEAIERRSEDGGFVVFPGIEYRCKRGDTAVLFGWLPNYDEVNRSEWTDIRAVWNGLNGKPYLTIPHFHNGGGLAEGEWWEHCESGVEPVLEIFSCHGSYEREDALEHHIPLSKASRPDRYGSALLKRGLRYGLVCNSDGHKGHVGTNGVTAVFARELTREAILEAYRARRVYGTTNARIRLVFTGNGHLMGSTVPNERRKVLGIDVTGQNMLKKIELFRNADPYRLIVPDPGSVGFKGEVALDDDDASSWYVRVTQIDNHIAWSSPVWYV